MTITDTSTIPSLGTGPKYQAFADVLRQRIRSGHYSIGQRLPSVIALSHEFGLSPGTIHKGLRVLTREKMLVCNTCNTGTIVMRSDPMNAMIQSTTLACLLRPLLPRNEVDNVGVDFLEGIRREIANNNYQFFYHSLDEANYLQRVIEVVAAEAAMGLILDQYTPDQEIAQLAKLGVPVVLYNRLLHMENVSSVCPDYERVGYQSFEKLLKRGYQRIVCYMSDIPPSANDPWFVPRNTGGEWFASPNALKKGFEAAARDHNFSIEIAWESAADAPAENLRRSLGIGKLKETSVGIFCVHDIQATRVMNAISETSLQPGQDVGIIGCFDAMVNRNSPHPASTWKMDCPAIGTESVKDIIARIDNPSLPRSIVKLPMEFVDHKTA